MVSNAHIGVCADCVCVPTPDTSNKLGLSNKIRWNCIVQVVSSPDLWTVTTVQCLRADKHGLHSPRGHGVMRRKQQRPGFAKDGNNGTKNPPTVARSADSLLAFAFVVADEVVSE